VHVLEEELAVDSVQDDGVKLPPLPPSFQETGPVGVVGDPAVSTTVAVNVIVLLTVTEEGFGVTVVVVACKEVPPCSIASATLTLALDCELYWSKNTLRFVCAEETT